MIILTVTTIVSMHLIQATVSTSPKKCFQSIYEPFDVLNGLYVAKTDCDKLTSCNSEVEPPCRNGTRLSCEYSYRSIYGITYDIIYVEFLGQNIKFVIEQNDTDIIYCTRKPFQAELFASRNPSNSRFCEENKHDPSFTCCSNWEGTNSAALKNINWNDDSCSGLSVTRKCYTCIVSIID